MEKEEKKSGKSKKAKKVSENENTLVVTPLTPKVDNKLQEQRIKKKDDNIEKDSDNSEEKSPKIIQTQEKTGPVFDELGGNFVRYIIILYSYFYTSQLFCKFLHLESPLKMFLNTF